METGGGMNIQMWLSRGEELCRERELQCKVWDELEWEPMLDPTGLTVDVTGFAATLRGTVKSYPEKLAAERAAKRVPGIQTLSSDITVTLPPASERTDPQLTEEVQRALEWDILVPHDKITPRIAAGWVTLEGTVDGDFQRSAAAEAVFVLMGVKGVSNLVMVKPPSRPANVKSRVEAALRRRADLHGDRIKVEARDGAVVLHGHVRSLAEREEAEQAVRAVPGVILVEDDLQIGR